MPINIAPQDLPVVPKALNNMEVLDLDPFNVGPAVYPRQISLKTPDTDGATLLATWYGQPRLSVGDIVICWRDGTDTNLLRIAGTGGNTQQAALGEFEPYPSGLIEGGEITDGTTPPTFTVAAGSGWIIDSTTDPDDHTAIFVQWSEFTDQSPLNFVAQAATLIMIDNTGALALFNTGNETLDRDYINLGFAIHIHQSTTISIVNFPRVVGNVGNYLYDLWRSTIGITLENCFILPNANLTVNQTAGNINGPGINWHNDRKQPNRVALSATDPLPFLLTDRDDVIGLDTLVPVGFWDNLGTVEAIPTVGDGGANRTAIYRIFMFANGFNVLLYPQEYYIDLATALVSITNSDANLILPEILQFSTLQVYILARRAATDLSDPAQVDFRYPGQAGGGAGGGGGGATTYLELTDTSNSYAGDGGKTLVVSNTEDSVEFQDIPPGTAEAVYRFNTSVAVADPGSGMVGLNNADPELATIVSVSSFDEAGTARIGLHTFTTQFDFIVLRDTNSAKNNVYVANDDGTDNTTWWQFAVTYIGGSPADLFANNEKLIYAVWINSVNEFIDLEDTPADYTGKGNNFVYVKPTEDGLEFAPLDFFSYEAVLASGPVVSVAHSLGIATPIVQVFFTSNKEPMYVSHTALDTNNIEVYFGAGVNTGQFTVKVTND